MVGYALITLKMIEYASICLKKQSAEYARILNGPEAGGQGGGYRCETRAL